jgi:hypothetical protein
VLAVGGQMMSLLLTLLAVPVIYSYLDDLGGLFQHATVRGRKQEERRPVMTAAPSELADAVP